MSTEIQIVITAVGWVIALVGWVIVYLQHRTIKLTEDAIAKEILAREIADKDERSLRSSGDKEIIVKLEGFVGDRLKPIGECMKEVSEKLSQLIRDTTRDTTEIVGKLHTISVKLSDMDRRVSVLEKELKTLRSDVDKAHGHVKTRL